VEQVVTPVAGDEEIIIAIVIVVTYGYALSISQIGIQSAAGGHVGEGAVAVIVKESAAGAVVNAARRIGRAGLDQQYVQKAVVIVVKEGAAGRAEFDIAEVAIGSVCQSEADAHAVGNIGE
jgi:hypothetical protein